MNSMNSAMWAGGERADDCDHGTEQVLVGYYSHRQDYGKMHYAPRDNFDEELLPLLSNNDPSILSLDWSFHSCHSYFPERAETIGDTIGKHTYLRRLYFGCGSNTSPEALTLFFTRVAENRSVEHFQMDNFDHRAAAAAAAAAAAGVDVFKILTPFLVHNLNLRCIQFRESDMSDTIISSLCSALSQSKIHQLERIDLTECTIGEEGAAQLINTLDAVPGLHTNLTDLCLGGNMIGKRGCAALCNLLVKSECKIQYLDLRYGKLDDDCIDILVGALFQNSNLKIKALNLKCQDFTSNGWRTLSAYLSLPSCTLEEIWLGGHLINDKGAMYLGEALVINKSLKCLDFCSAILTARGCREIAKCLRCPHSAILELYLDWLDVDYEGTVRIFSALSKNTTIKILSMVNFSHTSPSGWVTCFDMLLDSKTQFETLDFSRNDIGDEGVAALADLVANNMTTVKCITLHDNDSVTTKGWIAFADVLQPRSLSRLMSLSLQSDADLTDGVEIIIRFASALTYNTSLESIELSVTDIPTRGWIALSTALCDHRSIESICCNSNHTLHGFECYTKHPSEIDLLLDTNKDDNKAEVVRKKILLFHLSDLDNVAKAFGSMDTNVFPYGIEWIGRDQLGLSAMFYLFRSMPWLFNLGINHDDDLGTYEPSQKLLKLK